MAKLTTKPTRLPITLLSGFLGSGKTTLLEHILNSPDHGLKIAVIVNDMSTLNIDATLIEQHTVAQSREQLIKFQNGCICCTLRGDLLVELMKLAKSGEVEYVVIESTGISEPEQVAETFTAELVKAMMMGDEDVQGVEELGLDEADMKMFRELDDMGGLNAIAYLDTCVTVIDAFNLMNNFNTADFLSDRWGKTEKIAPEDERTISDLLVDQIEFADVILINKIDQVDAELKARVLGICKKLNPSAKVIETKYSKVDVKEVINTGLYSYEKAKMGSGWLRSLHDLTLRDVNGKKRMAPKPETEEYGVSSCIYEARRPFHPERLFRLLHDKFVLLQNVERYDDDSDDDGSDEDAEESGDAKETENSEEPKKEDEIVAPPSLSFANSGTASPENEKTSDSEDSRRSSETKASSVDECDLTRDIPVAEILANRAKHPVFKNLYRSKGFWWHANRPYQHGEWSQAGGILTTQGGNAWFCTIDDADWPDDPDAVEGIRGDFSGDWGDRRQEIVFIGEKLDPKAIKELLDACLLNDDEMKKWEKVMKKAAEMELAPERLERKLETLFEDGWEDWATAPLMGDEEGHEGHHH